MQCSPQGVRRSGRPQRVTQVRLRITRGYLEATMLRRVRVVCRVLPLTMVAALGACCELLSADDQAACNATKQGTHVMHIDPDTLWLLGPGMPATAVARINTPDQTSYQLTVRPLPSGLSVSVPPSVVGSAAILVTAEALAFSGTATLLIDAHGRHAGGSQGTNVAFVVTTTKPFTLATLSQGVTIQQGSSGTLPLTVSRAASFTGHVVLTGAAAATGLATSVTAGPLPVVSGTATVTVGGNVAPGQYDVVLRGSYRSFFDTLIVPVTVTTPPPPPDFRLSFAKNALTIERGDNATTTMDIARAAPLIGAIQLLAQGPPAGVNIRYSANPATGSTSDVTVDVTSGALPGTYTFDITGTWQSITRSASLTLTIKDPDYSLTVAPAPLTVVRGSTASVTLGFITSSRGIQTVQLSKQPEPAGIAIALPASLAVGATVVVPISVAAQFSSNTATLRILGDALGIKRSVDVVLTIQNPQVADFQIVPPAGPNVVRQNDGHGTPFTIAIVRHASFIGVPINLSVVGLASHEGTLSLSPTQTTGNSTTVSVYVNSSVPPGSKNLTITGTANGITRTATLTLTVVPPL